MTESQTWEPRVHIPAAVRWAAAFNLLHGGLLLGLVAVSGGRTWRAGPDAPPADFLPPLVLLVAAGIFMATTLLLRRGSFHAWVLQLVLLCAAAGLVPLPGALWAPLVVAWCSPAVRDWFDPPLRRDFG
ncbi:MAG: hypothetical protein HYU66_27460 [Armatimonadetes bacterium]|nr:hypothetical protein [Armatimonadota bacterium]